MGNLLPRTILITSTDKKSTYEINENTIREQNVSPNVFSDMADIYQEIDSYIEKSKGVYNKKKLKEISLKAKDAELRLQKLWNFSIDENKLKWCHIIYPRTL